MTFVATTLTVYVTAFLSPVIVALFVPVLVTIPPDSEGVYVTVYPVIVAPPVLGVVHDTSTVLLPGVAVTFMLPGVVAT
jgi:hypothetical protein